jgi:hypothetical protein
MLSQVNMLGWPTLLMDCLAYVPADGIALSVHQANVSGLIDCILLKCGIWSNATGSAALLGICGG